MYIGLSVLNELYCNEVIAIVRRYLSDIPLFQLRESVLFLLEIVTDLSRLPAHLFQSGTPFLSMLQRAVLDSLYFGSANRPSKLFLFFIFNYSFVCRLRCSNRLQAWCFVTLVGHLSTHFGTRTWNLFSSVHPPNSHRFFLY